MNHQITEIDSLKEDNVNNYFEDMKKELENDLLMYTLKYNFDFIEEKPLKPYNNSRDKEKNNQRYNYSSLTCN